MKMTNDTSAVQTNATKANIETYAQRSMIGRRIGESGVAVSQP
jgi:hypothetical protein